MPQHVDHAVVLFGFNADRFVERLQEAVDRTRGGDLSFVAEQVLFGRFARVGELERHTVFIVAVGAAADRHEVDVHDRQPRHDKRA